MIQVKLPSSGKLRKEKMGVKYIVAKKLITINFNVVIVD